MRSIAITITRLRCGLLKKQVEDAARCPEVVIIFNGERKVEFANRAAEQLFGRGGHCGGFGSRLMSAALLELLKLLMMGVREIEADQY